MAKKFKTLDLFAGCGGMSQGFEESGSFDVVVANEMWKPAADTWKNNHKGKMIVGDITSKEVQDAIVAGFDSSPCEVIIGGPPCVAYSMAGNRDPNDPRGKLFEQYVALVKRLQPKFFVMENVKGILSMKHAEGSVPEIITKKFKDAGYEVTHKLLLASSYGVPQARERVIFVGWKSDLGIDWEWPAETHGEGKLPPVTVRQAISDLEEKPQDAASNHVHTKHSEEYIKTIHKTKIGTSVTGYSETCFRCDPDLPSKTVKANNGGVFIHYLKDRCMSVRELARLQSFPDDFIFKGGKSDMFKQIGNAVPVMFAKAIAKSVAKALNQV